jgi:hypothetical protein
MLATEPIEIEKQSNSQADRECEVELDEFKNTK